MPRRPAGRDRFRDLAGLVCAVEALALAGFCGFYLWELTQGASDDPTRVVMSAVLIALFAVGIGRWRAAGGRGRTGPAPRRSCGTCCSCPWRGASCSRDRGLVAAAVALVAVAGIVGAIGADTSTEDETVDG